MDGETVSASASSPRLQPVVIGNSGVGVVIGGTTIVIIPDGMGPCPPPTSSCQNPGTRDAQSVCVYPNKPDGTACDDDNACTRTDVCQAGACVGANPVACIPPDTCHSASCNPATGVCTTTTVAGACNLGAFDYDKAGASSATAAPSSAMTATTSFARCCRRSARRRSQGTCASVT